MSYRQKMISAPCFLDVWPEMLVVSKCEYAIFSPTESVKFALNAQEMFRLGNVVAGKC